MKKKFYLSLILFFVFFGIKAQTFIGAQTGIDYVFGVKPMIPLGLHFDALLWEQPFSFGFNYRLPIKVSGTDYLNPYDNSLNQREITVVDKLGLVDVHVLYKYFFGDGAIDDGGFYACGGGALAFGKSTTTLEPYDQTIYHYDTPLKSNYFQAYLCLGLGYDLKLDNDHMLGFQFILNLNSTSYNSRSGASGDIQLPSMVGLRAMYSLPIGN